MAEVTAMRNNALPYPIYGCPFVISFPFWDTDSLVTGASAPDAEISKNGDTYADCTNESTEIATSSGTYYLIITGAELTCDLATIIAKSTTSGLFTTVATLSPRKLVTVRAGTAQGGSASTITLDASASALDDFYNGMVCVATIDAVVEVRMIGDYVGSSKVATIIGPDWVQASPDSDDTFVIKLPEGVQVGSSTVVGWQNVAVTAGAIPAAVAGATGGLFIAGTNAATAITTSFTTTFTGNLTGSVGSVAAGGITASSFAADAITAAKVAADVTTEIQSGLATAAALVTVDGVVDAIKAVTDLLPNAGALTSLASSAQVSPAASGTADSGSTTTMVDAARTESDTDYWVGSLLVFTSGVIAGQARIITGSVTGTITFSPATTQAVSTQTYEIWP